MRVAEQGHGVLVYCTEVPEVYELADRVIVVDEGRAGTPMEVSSFGDLTALADAIATFEHTAVEATPVPDLDASSGQGARKA